MAIMERRTVFAFLVLLGAAASTAGQLDDGVAINTAPLLAAAVTAPERCNACPIDGVVCAEMPTVPGVKQTVQSRCLAECQGFKDIQAGPCSDGPGAAKSAASDARMTAKHPAFKDGPCSATRQDIFKFANEGAVFLGCVKTTTPDDAAAAAAAVGANTQPGQPAPFKLRAADLVTKPDQPYLLVQHIQTYGTDFYYIKAMKTSGSMAWSQMRANTGKTRLATPASSANPGINAGTVPNPSPAPSVAAAATDAAAPSATLTADTMPVPIVDDASTAPAAGSNITTAGRHLLQIRDNRYRPGNLQTSPFWNYGQLTFSSNRGGFLCSGSFMSPDDVITAAHCVVDSVTGEAYKSFRFAPAKDGGSEPYGSWGWRTTTWWSAWVGRDYTGSDGAVAGSAYLDTALVYIDRVSFGWAATPISGPCGRITRNVRSCGYPGDKGGSQMWCSDGSTAAVDLCDNTADALRSNNIFLAGGMSGGPVVTSDNLIVGINSGGSSFQTIFAPLDVYNNALNIKHASIWSSTYAFRQSTGSIRISGGNNKCMDVNPETSGTSVQVWDCNNTGAQNKFFRPSATTMELRFGSLCLDISGGSNANGARVQVWSCNGSAAQKFFYDKESRLRPLFAPNKCVDVPGGNFSNGVKLQLWDCNFTAAQRFAPV